MKKYSESDNYILFQGNMLDMLHEIKSNTIDNIVTDPPYELNFMNKGWDNSGIAFNKETWQKCYEVLKPGGYLLAFGGTRTYHRIACAIEDAGFEIRDCIMWLYGSGFPKSMNIGLAIDKKNGIESKVIGMSKSGAKETHTNSLNLVKNPFGGEYEVKEAQNKWNGWGTCLKPAYEPIIVARKPFKGSLVDNVIENGVGGLNIDECRIETKDNLYRKPGENGSIYSMTEKKYSTGSMNDNYKLGRFPANVIHNGLQEEWSRYFYAPKASKKDRDEGLDEFEKDTIDDGRNKPIDNPFQRGKTQRHNIHPTVKPTELMQYLVRLVTPKNGIVLDPFMGSGSTGKAVMYENKERNSNYKFIGIELTEEYLPIAEARINYANKHATEKNKEKQLDIFED